jgi:hypothetical protein
MSIELGGDNLKQGVLSLVMALVEILRDALSDEAFRRVESGDLTEEEVERLGRGLVDLEEAIESIKREQGVVETTRKVREGLDNIVDEVLNKMINPEDWAPEEHSLTSNHPARISGSSNEG